MNQPDFENVIDSIRSLWKNVEKADEAEKIALKKQIVASINRLRSRIEKQLDHTSSLIHEPLFNETGIEPKPDRTASSALQINRFSEYKKRVYAKDLTEHAFTHIPKAFIYNDIERFRDYLINNLRFNSKATRRRNANYIINRYFPGEYFNTDLPAYSAAVKDTPALGEALFYLTCRTEKIVAMVAEDVVFPALTQGVVSRNRLYEYVRAQFPKSKSIRQMGGAIVNTYHVFGIGSATRTCLNFSIRTGSLVSFAYLLHLEFPEPGMYSFEKLLEGPLHKWLLWDKEWMIRQLYRLREAGLLSKVSDIDRMRQFTTKYSLSDAVQYIVPLATEKSE